MARVVGELAVQLAALAHVVEHQHAARDRARAVADRRGGALDVHLVAVALDQQRRPHRLDRAAAADRDRQRVLERLAGLLVEAAEDVVDGPALRLLEAPAGELLGDRVEVLDDQRGVGGDHAVADRLQRDLRALLLLEQRVLVELALGDVELDARPAAAAGRSSPRAPWRGSPPSATRRCCGACGARSRTSASCPRCGRGSPPARAPCRRGARGAASPARRAGRARRSRASCASAARTRRCCSRRRSPTGRRWRRAATASLRSSSRAEVALHAQALEAGGEARADQLEQQVQVDVPALGAAARSTAP